MASELTNRLKSSLAAALMQNSPLAAVPVEDLREATERLDVDAALFRELDEWWNSKYTSELYAAAQTGGRKTSLAVETKIDGLWRRVAEEAKRDNR